MEHVRLELVRLKMSESERNLITGGDSLQITCLVRPELSCKIKKNVSKNTSFDLSSNYQSIHRKSKYFFN